jgi:hypothetical protein
MKDWEILSVDPFAGDFGSPGDRTFSDKIVIARKAGECHCCAQTIKPKERIRRRVDLFDGHVHTFRWCSACCDAMALSRTDAGAAWTARERLRSDNAP